MTIITEEDEAPKLKLVDCQPERVDFNCHECGRGCVLEPRKMPMEVRHEMPTCKAWKECQLKGHMGTGAFLRACGVPIG